MPIRLTRFEFRTRHMRTRFPFQYGIASMTELPHVFLHIETDDGPGLASEGLPPKWFTKNPDTRFEADLPLMLEVLQQAAETAVEIPADRPHDVRSIALQNLLKGGIRPVLQTIRERQKCVFIIGIGTHVSRASRDISGCWLGTHCVLPTDAST